MMGRVLCALILCGVLVSLPWATVHAQDGSDKLIGIDDNEEWVVTPDGYAINTGVDSFYPPHGNLPDDHRLPPIELPTIGDRLSAAGVSWYEYNGSWQDALDGAVAQPLPFIPRPPLSFHGYFEPYGPDMPGRTHLKDAQEFVPDLINGALGAVTILKPSPAFDEHTGYSMPTSTVTLPAGPDQTVVLLHGEQYHAFFLGHPAYRSATWR